MKYLNSFSLFVESISLNTETFKKMCKDKYKNLYDYSQMKFDGLKNNIRVICKKHHTPFIVNAKDHLNGKGCPFCQELDLPKKVSNQEGYDTIASTQHFSGRNHYAPKPRTIPYTIRKN